MSTTRSEAQVRASYRTLIAPFVTPAVPVRHGTERAYRQRGCRCEICAAAQRERRQTGRRRRREGVASEPLTGERHPNAKLTWAQVGELRSLYTRGVSVHHLAAEFGVCRKHVRDIARMKWWNDGSRESTGGSW